MKFTDEDLQAIRDELDKGYGLMLRLQPYQWKALLHRLECAEWAMSELEHHECKGYLHGDFVQPLKAWRKSKGL